MASRHRTAPTARAPRPPQARPSLTRHIRLSHGVALYVSAILGAGVLVLPGQAATLAGPASLVSWAFACAMGLPLAAMFAALARRHPEAGGVASYVRHGLGTVAGGLSGWWYFVAGSVGQTIVPLTGGYYVAQALGLGTAGAFSVALLILAAATASNLAGMRVSGRIQLALAVIIATALVVTVVVAVPHMDATRMHPFAPHGMLSVGTATVMLFFAFAGWETIAHLAEEFHDPQRDIPRAVGISVGVITMIYLGVATAVVLTGTYGSARTDHVSISLILQDAFGRHAAVVAAIVALVITIATTTAFISGVSRLGYALALDRWLPKDLAHLDSRGVPRGGVLLVSAIAGVGLVLSAAVGWGTEELITIPSTLVVVVYLLTAVAGVRLLRGAGRAAAIAALVLAVVIAPSALPHLVIPTVVAGVALLTRRLAHR